MHRICVTERQVALAVFCPHFFQQTEKVALVGLFNSILISILSTSFIFPVPEVGRSLLLELEPNLSGAIRFDDVSHP